MKKITFVLFVMIKFSCFSDNLDRETPQLVSVDKLNFRNIDAILHILKQYGKDKKPNDVAKSVLQYTCTTVLSEEEINDISSWINGNQFPNTFIENNRRIQVQYNENEEHGEKIVLRDHMDRLIEQMETDSHAKGHNTYPIVILYSYNIPCSIQNHECAMLLKEDKEKRLKTATEYTLIIGFSLFFQFRGNKTRNVQNRQMSYKRLAIDGIQVRKMFNMFKNNQFTSLVLGDSHIEGDISFQYIIYSCLIGQPALYTCNTELSNIDENQVKRIYSFSINNMFFECQTASKNYHPRCVFKDSDIYKCLKEWIANNIGADCDGPDLQRIWIHFLDESIRQGREMATFIGVPNGLYLDKPQWVNPAMTWRQRPSDFIRARNILCFKTNLDPGSFCTKLKAENVDLESRKRTTGPLPGQYNSKNVRTAQENKIRGLL